MIPALLVLLFLALLLLAWVVRGNRRDQREWETRSRRLHDPRSMNRRSLIVPDDPNDYVWAPGAMWLVDDPLDVQVLYRYGDVAQR